MLWDEFGVTSRMLINNHLAPEDYLEGLLMVRTGTIVDVNAYVTSSLDSTIWLAANWLVSSNWLLCF